MKKTVLKVWTGNIWEALYPETSADCVKMSDGQSVEAVLNTLAAFNPSEYVKKTNYATNKDAGVIKAQYAYGFYGAPTGELILQMASENDIATKTQQYRPIVPYNLDSAVKTSVTTNTIPLTDEEKTAACGWLGALQDKSGKGIRSVLYSIDYEGRPGLRPYAEGGRASAVHGTIPLYIKTATNWSSSDLSAALWTATPQYNYQCANKKYVDDTVANVATGGTIDLSNYVQKSTTYPDLLAVYGRGTKTQGFPEQLFTLSYTPSWGSLVRWGDPNNVGADNGTNYDSATICCPDPKQPYQTANKKYVDNGFIPKPATTTYDRVLMQSKNNSLVWLGAAVTKSGGSIPIRESDGRIKVGTPTSAFDATTKQYVDEEIEDKLSGISGLYEHFVNMTVETQEHDEIELIIRFLSGSSEAFGDGEFLLEELVSAINTTIRPLLIDDASYLGIGVISNIMDMWYNPNDGTLDITVNSVNGLDYRTLIQIISYDYEVTPYGEVV